MRAIIALLLLSTLALAQWGPGGIPTDWRDYGIEWMESSKFTSPSATNYQYFASSAAADSLVWVQTGAAGDRDMVNKYVEEDGTVHYWRWDDASNYFFFSNGITTANNITANYYKGLASSFSIGNDGSGLGIATSAAYPRILNDPNSSGAGTLILGETGDRDINYLNGRLRTNITTVAVATTMGASDGYMYTMTANDTLRCPTTPLAGEVLMCKFTHASGGWVKGMGNTIDGAANVAASEDDNVVIVWNSSTSDWERRE